LARTLPFAEGVAIADSALNARLTSKAELAAVIADCPRWPGLQRAREVTAFSDARSESVLESLSRAAFRQAGLPPPDLQVWVGDDGEIIGRADFLMAPLPDHRRGRRSVQVPDPGPGPRPAGT
jgi:hypothetical protein